MPAAKRRTVAPPTLEERAKALVADAERIDVEADALLDELADKYRHANIPAAWLRMNWLARVRDEHWRGLRAALLQIGG
jgi:hypothetical protein